MPLDMHIRGHAFADSSSKGRMVRAFCLPSTAYSFSRIRHTIGRGCLGRRLAGTNKRCDLLSAVRCAAVPTTEKETKSGHIDGSHAVSDEMYQSTAYPFTAIESKWRAYWEEHQTFRTPEFKDLDTSKPKFYALDMFPYPRYAVLWSVLASSNAS